MSVIGSAAPAFAPSIAAAGVASAGARLDAAASAVSSDPTGDGLAQAAVALTQSKVAFSSSVNVAAAADQLQGILVDLLA